MSRHSTKTLALISIIVALNSCKNLADNSVADQANQNFDAQFGVIVNKINSNRIEPDPANKMAPQNLEPAIASPKKTPIINGRVEYPTSSLDAALLNPQGSEPNADTFLSGQRAVNQTNNFGGIFDLNYNTNPQGPFIVRGAEFDSIQIPSQDFFGVKSSLSEKQYLLVGNRALQKNIDRINDSKSSYDNELSQTLAKEQTHLQKQRSIAKIFKDDSAVKEAKKAKLEKEEADRELARQERLKNQDPIKKIIALQVIEENKRKNAPVDPNQTQQGQQQNQNQQTQ